MTWISSEDAFAAWAPEDVLWSQWAKPIAFINQEAGMVAEPLDESLLPAMAPALPPDSVLIIDLPGAEAVYAGLSVARGGFRPVPLFNGTTGPAAVVDVGPIAAALANAVAWLKDRTLAADAPPAFLIESRRGVVSAPPEPGAYDNRWVVLPQDFPSGSLLCSRGIRRVTIIHRRSRAVAPDLAHVLRRWQESGLTIRVVDLTTGQFRDNEMIGRPSGFRKAWYAAIALLGLRRSNVGGFGSTIPDAGEHGGVGG